MELTSFTAEIVYEDVVLNWQTATEVNNYGFEVQRQNAKRNSDNVNLGPASPINGYAATSWETIGFVPGHGNSNSPKKYSFYDPNTPSGKIQYRLKQIDSDGQFEYSEVIEINVNAPDKFKLYQNYPNPFNPSTTISYSLPSDSKVKLEIFNSLGQCLDIIADGVESAGLHSMQWNAINFSSGLYIIRFTAIQGNNNNNYTQTIKMILMK